MENNELHIREVKKKARKLLKGNYNIGAILNSSILLFILIPFFWNILFVDFFEEASLFFIFFHIFISFLIKILGFTMYFCIKNCFFDLSDEKPKLEITNFFIYFKEKFGVAFKYKFLQIFFSISSYFINLLNLYISCL